MAKTILERLNDARVMCITPTPDGLFLCYERCDEYYDLTLTKDELLQLADEIKEMAG